MLAGYPDRSGDIPGRWPRYEGYRLSAMASPPALENVPCYYCGGTEGLLWGEEAGYRARKCAECGLVYVSPRPRQDDIAEAARTGEHAGERGALSVTGRYRESRARHHRKTIDRMFGDLAGRAGLRWLDIGAGFGELLGAVSSAFPGAALTGVEPNAAKRQAAQERGLTLTDVPLAALPRRGFDVVSVINVWSHLPDPAEFLGEVHSLLAHEGHVLVETGTGGELDSAESYPDALLLPDHLSFAGERHVVGILERTGFVVELVRRRRVDTISFAAERAAKRALGRPTRLIVPYRSPFRTICVRARVDHA